MTVACGLCHLAVASSIEWTMSSVSPTLTLLTVSCVLELVLWYGLSQNGDGST